MQDAIYKSALSTKIRILHEENIISEDVFNKLNEATKNELYNDVEDYIDRKWGLYKEKFNSTKNRYSDFTGNSRNIHQSDDEDFFNAQLKLESENNRLKSEITLLSKEYDSKDIENNNLKKNIEEITSEYVKLRTSYDKITSEFTQKRIDEEIPTYVEDVSGKLEKDDQFFTDMARNWSIIGVSVTLFAVLAAFCTFTQGTDLLIKNPDSNFIGLLYIFIRGALGIGLLSWLAYVCFSNSRNYTHESIRRKDRQHALSFGRLFLQIYGSSAEKKETIEVFKDWNMSGDSAFSKENNKTPPNIIDAFKSFSGSLKKNKEE
ncbi:Uncharacterised protein [Yersinia mollaretii]|uniref:hypothetical protein n=2 Tax=Yersinia mollaretii TaxID=33060 RepID=UPI0005E1654D|nr:hypothetical protein [Yersinia mollaretii]CQR08168.1 Uncharacterised protein [Yersinia mollaretii]